MRCGSAPASRPRSPERDLYFFELDDSSRDADVLRAVLQAVEQWVVHDGATRLALNIFGPTGRDQALSERRGYVVAATSMFKGLEWSIPDATRAPTRPFL